MRLAYRATGTLMGMHASLGFHTLKGVPEHGQDITPSHEGVSIDMGPQRLDNMIRDDVPIFDLCNMK